MSQPGFSEDAEPQEEGALVWVQGGDGQGKRGSSQVLSRWERDNIMENRQRSTKGLQVTGKREIRSTCSLSSLIEPL